MENKNGVTIHSHERLDELHRNGYWIIQDPGRFCFGMDAVLLSGFAKVKPGERALDLGTGTGIIPILLEAKTKGEHFTGLEIQPESADMAARSVAYNHLEEKITIVTGDIVFSEQYKNNTLKNEVSYGLSRGRIYLGKLLMSMGIAVLAAVVMMGFYLGLCWVLFPHTELDGMAWQLISYCLAGAFPLWLAAQAMVNTCYFLVRGTNIAAFTAAGLLAVLPAILQAFGILFHPAFEVLRQFMPGVMLENLKNMAFQWNYVGLCWAAGLAWLAAATAVGLLAFRRKEIR